MAPPIHPAIHPGSERRTIELGFNLSQRSAKPGDVVQFPLFVSNNSSHPWKCRYRLDADRQLVGAWTVVGPDALGAGQRRQGHLEVRVPKLQPGTYPLKLQAIPNESTELAVAEAVLVIEAKRCVFLPSLPTFELQPDGSVIATLSLGNCGNIDCKASIQIRHKQGWNFEIDSPEVTVSSGIKGVKAKLTLRPPRGKSARQGDEVTLTVSWQGQTLLVQPLKGHIEVKTGPPPVVRNAIVIGSAVVALVGGVGIWAATRTPRVPSPRPTTGPSVLGTVLEGTGTSGLVPKPTELRFTGQAVNTRSQAQPVIVTNSGTAPVFVAGTKLIGANARDFVRGRDTCSTTRLAPSQTCLLEVAFAPMVDGGRSATLVVTGDRGATIASIALIGEATATAQQRADLSVDTPIVAFGDQRLGTSSASQTVLVRNNATEAVRLEPATLTGADRGDFSLRDACSGQTLPASDLCRLQVVFTPRGVGGRSATLTIPHGDAPRPLTVALSGTGTAPVLHVSSGSLDFPSQQVGTTSAQKSVMVTNSGTASASIISVTRPSGKNPGDFLVNDQCARNLPPGTGCTVRASFKPTAAGVRRAALTIAHDAPGSPATVVLTGSGTPPPPPSPPPSPPPPVPTYVTVSGRGNIFGAGHATPPGPGGGGSGEMPPSVPLPAAGGKVLTFARVTGEVTCDGSGKRNGPEGSCQQSTDIQSSGGVAGIVNSQSTMFLVGVFLNDQEPRDPAPPRLDFSPGSIGQNFRTIAPKLNQIFFIGDGLTGTRVGERQQFVVPPGATRLFLGFADAWAFHGNPGWYDDNTGQFDVELLIQ